MRGGDCRKFCFQFNSLKKGEERLLRERGKTWKHSVVKPGRKGLEEK